MLPKCIRERYMDSAWEAVSQLSIGTIVAWVIFIAAIIGGISALTVKLYKVFEKYKGYQDTNKKIMDMLQSHESTIVDIKNALIEVRDARTVQNNIMKKQIGHSIVVTAEKCIAEGKITFSEMKSIMELYEVYHDVYKGNSYVEILMENVKKLNVIGKPTQ